MIPDLQNLFNKYRMAADVAYAKCLPEDLVGAIKKYASWFRQSTNIDVRTATGLQASIQFFDMEKFSYSRRHYRHFYGDAYRPVGDSDLPPIIDQELFDELSDTREQILKLQSDIADVHRNIVAKIRGRSIKVICEGWPEITEIVEKMTFSSMTPRTALSIAPALNEKLGISTT